MTEVKRDASDGKLRELLKKVSERHPVMAEARRRRKEILMCEEIRRLLKKK